MGYYEPKGFYSGGRWMRASRKFDTINPADGIWNHMITKYIYYEHIGTIGPDHRHVEKKAQFFNVLSV